MPLAWRILPASQLVKVRTAGAVRFDDVTAYLEAVRAGGAIGFRKLCDARQGYTDMTQAELISYLGSVAGLVRLSPPGPQALVVSEASKSGHELMLRMIHVSRDRDVRMFTDLRPAARWLHAQPLPERQQPSASGRSGRDAG